MQFTSDLLYQPALLQPPVSLASEMDFLKFHYCDLCNQIKTGRNDWWHLQPTPNLEETFRYKSVTSTSMLQHAPSAGRSLHLHKHVLSSHIPPTCVWDFLTQQLHSLTVFRAPLSLTPLLHEVKGNHEYNLLRWRQCGAPLPDPEGQIHESYAKTVQELKAMVHQLWDQGDMLDEMRQWWDCSTQTSMYLIVFVFICHIKLMQSFVHQ